MRFRFWLGLTAVLLIGIGSVVAAIVVHADDEADFEARQRDAAARSARSAEAVAGLSVGQLASAAAFFQAEGDFTEHEFDVISAPLLQQGALSGTAFIERVPGSERAAFERRTGAPIFESGADGPQPARERTEYYPISYAASAFGGGGPIGYDMAVDPERGPFLRRARDRGRPAATPTG
jgi:CHASE1-domain containing sensor protein